MARQVEQTAEYRCPGQRHPISRAVHLGRLARFYPGCRQCAHRDDTGTLSDRQVEQLVETRPRGLPRPLFHEEGAAGVYLNDLTPEIARQMAAALGVALQRRDGLEGEGTVPFSLVAQEEGTASVVRKGTVPFSLVAQEEGTASVVRKGTVPFSLGAQEEETASVIQKGTVPFSLRENRDSPHVPVVVIAGDGRPSSCELVAAVGEGLRWAGCRVVDIGPATAACLTFALDHLAGTGGILVGNEGDRPHTVGLKFWAGGPRPLSAGGPLEKLQQLFRTGVDRPTRTYGPLRRFQADAPYLAGLAEHYHALRPLRFVLDTTCGPLITYLKRLTEPCACRIIRGRADADHLPEQLLAEKAHFAVGIGDDGETCHLFDEQGRAVPAERLMVLLTRHLLGDCPNSRAGDCPDFRTGDCPDFRAAKMGLSPYGPSPYCPDFRTAKTGLPPSPAPQRTIVLEEGTPATVAQAIRTAGGNVVFSNPRRAEMAAAMREHAGLLGGGASGRLWYDSDGLPLPDALRTLSLLLVLLSQSDQPLSEVLDRRAAVG